MTKFAKEMCFEKKASSRKSPKDQSLVRLLKSQAFVASGIMLAKLSVHVLYGDTKTRFLSSDPNELCDRIKLSTQEKKQE